MFTQTYKWHKECGRYTTQWQKK